MRCHVICYGVEKQINMNLIDKIIDYECGHLGKEDTLEFFSNLIKTGMVNSLQGHYGRSAQHFIRQGYINEQGDIL